VNDEQNKTLADEAEDEAVVFIFFYFFTFLFFSSSIFGGVEVLLSFISKHKNVNSWVHGPVIRRI
jgi:hypothetical protein